MSQCLRINFRRSLHGPLSSSRYAPHLSTISESPLAALRRYSPATTIPSRPKRVIDTADIDVSTPRALSSAGNNQQRTRLRRDRPTIRIRSQALKDNPALREHYERHEKTVGELLVEKFLIKDKKPDSDVENRPKFYTQVSLDSASSKRARDEVQEAMQRRVTRRMTRRRSSADMQMDPEQLEREVMFAQAQADALDTLVAEEQAEIEVETRMGTLIRKNFVRATPSVLGKHESQPSGDEDEDESRVKKSAKKVKKRKKTSDKPSPPSESELESESDASRAGNLRRDADQTNGQDVCGATEIAAINGADAEIPGEEKIDDPASSPTKALKFKIEASNSVGDFSTLWINAGAGEELDKGRTKSQPVVEQFRDSVRLPAPKQAAQRKVKSSRRDPIIEEHQEVVVLPVRSRYVKDDSRNSVYLTLKSPKTGAETAKLDEEDEDNEEKPEEIIAAVDSIGASSRRKDDGVDDDQLSMPSLIAIDTAAEPRINNVAKFRSKDTTESDIEVGISSVSPGEAEGTRNLNARSKDGGLQKLSELASCTSDVEAKKSFAPAVNRSEIAAPASRLGDSSIVEAHSKRSVVSSERAGVKNIEKNRSIDNIGESRLKAVSFGNEDGSKAVAAASDAGLRAEIGKLVKDERKGTKFPRVKIGKTSGEGAKRIKRSESEVDCSRPRTAVGFERSKSDGQEKSGEASTIGVISGDLSETSTAPRSLPNASAIDPIDSRDGFDDTLKTRGSKDNVDTVATERPRLNGDLSRSTETKAIAADGEVDALSNFRGGKSKSRDIAVETKSDTAKVLTPTKRDENIFEFEAVDKLGEKSKRTGPSSVNKIIEVPSPKITAPKRKDENVPECREDSKVSDKPLRDASSVDDNVKDNWKLRSELELSRNLDYPEGEAHSESPDLKIVNDSPKKIDSATKKPAIFCENGEKSPRTADDKTDSSVDDKKKLGTVTALGDSPKDSSKTAIDEKKAADGALGNGIGTAKIIAEPTKLTNGVRKVKPKATEDIKDIRLNVKPEVPKLKISKKPETPPVDEAAKTKPEVPKFKILKKPKTPPADETEKAKPEVPKKTLKKPAIPPANESKIAKPEVPTSKDSRQSETATADEGIDFWGEIESQRVANPVSKPKFENPVETPIPVVAIGKTENSSEACEVKSNPPSGTGAPVPTKTAENIAADEKKTNKIKKKKTVESTRKKDQEKPGEETIFERFINGDGGDGKKLQQPQQEQQQSEKCSRNDKTVIESQEILEVDRFGRNLSVIDEETPASPTSEELPRDIELEAITKKKVETAEAKLDPPKDSVSFGTGSTEETASKMIIPGAEAKFGAPGVTVAPESRTSGIFVPTINIVEPENSQEDARPGEAEEAIPENEEEEEEEGPGTPTNETVNETINETPRTITKWNGSADLSLDEPDKDIGPEVYLAEKVAREAREAQEAKEAKKESSKKESSKKKTSTKKGSSKKGSVGSNSPGTSPDSSKKKKVVKKKKASTKIGKDIEKRTIFEERSESKLSNSSDTTLKPSALHLRNSPNNSPRNSPKQRPLDLIKIFYTTPASLLTATPRDLSKVKRAKIKKKKHSSRTASASSDSTGSTRSTQSTGTAESTGSTEHEDDPEQKRISSTRSNDSGFDGSPRLSSTDSFNFYYT